MPRIRDEPAFHQALHGAGNLSLHRIGSQASHGASRQSPAWSRHSSRTLRLRLILAVTAVKPRMERVIQALHEAGNLSLDRIGSQTSHGASR